VFADNNLFVRSQPLPTTAVVAHRPHPAVEVEHHLAVQVAVGACPGLGQTAAADPNVVRQSNGTIPSPSTPAEARN
jgi:hypothetical protein